MNENQNQNENPAPDEFQDELISAYLDGELTPAEKSRVEEQLMDSAAHRQLFEELKSLRNSLQALPVDSLDRDFASRVMQRAEQQLLTEEVEPDNQPLAATPRANVASSTNEPGAWRGLIWSVAAIAAAVMLIVFGPLNTERDNNRPVVKNDPVVEAENENVADQRNARPSTDHVSELRKGNADRGQPSPVEAGSTVADKEQAKNNARDIAELKSQANEADKQLAVPPAVMATEGERPELHNGVPQIASGQQPFRANLDASDNTPGMTQFGAASAKLANQNFASSELEQQGARYQYADMMVVSVDVTREALSRHFMDELLQKHEIQTELAQADIAEQLNGVKESKDGQFGAADKAFEKHKQQADSQQLAQADTELSDAPQDADSANERVARRSQRDELHKLDDVAQRKRFNDQQSQVLAKRDGDVDLMVVVATPQQIDRLLGDLQAQQGDVLAMAYDRPLGTSGGKYRQQTSVTVPRNRGKASAGNDLADDANAGLGAAIAAPQSIRADVVADGVTGSPPEPGEVEKGAVAAAPEAPKQEVQETLSNDSIQPADRREESRAVEAEDFRGIARRLHLPEDFQKLLVQPQAAATPNYGREAIADAAPPSAEGQGQSGGAGRFGNGDVAPAVPDKGVPEKTADAKNSNAQPPLMRVLFVLRAADRAPAAPLTGTLPAEISPANAALQEPATQGAETTAPVDE